MGSILSSSGHQNGTAPDNFTSNSTVDSLLNQSIYDQPVLTTSNPSVTASLNISEKFNTTLDGSIDDKLELFGFTIHSASYYALFKTSVDLLSSLAMIIGCVMPYVPQYITIYKSRSCRGFSTFVCLTLFISNILRIIFWFGHHFEIALIVQSVVQLIAQILLLELCVRTSRRSVTYRNSILNNPIRCFWRWTDLWSYILFLVIFTMLSSAAMYFFIQDRIFVQAVGFVALLSESMLGLPQLIKNQQNKSVQGMSLSMVLMWLAGDSYKTAYFVLKEQPIQFLLCGVVQITIDLIIMLQVCVFSQNAPTKKPSSPGREVSMKNVGADVVAIRESINMESKNYQ